MATKKQVTAPSKAVLVVKEGMVRVKVLKPFEAHEAGDLITVPERKVRDSSRLLRKGFIKLV